MLKDVLPLGHHLRSQARAFKPSWRPNPYQVRIHLGFQDQSVVKWTSRMHPDSVFDDPHIDGKIIS
jgi:hypothetical protein